MSQSSIPVRFDSSTAAFLTQEAARHGVSRSEFIRMMVGRGILSKSIEDAVAEIGAASGGGAGGITAEGFKALMVNIIETRNLLRMISAKNYPEAVTEAKRMAQEEVERLFSGEVGNVG